MRNRRLSAAFTMVELLVAVTIGLIVAAGMYALYENYVRAFVAQDRVLQTQQAARIAIDTMTQDLIRAGYKVPAGQPALSLAGNGVIELQLFNEQAGSQERIRYFVDGSNRLQRQVFRPGAGVWDFQAALSGPLIDDVRFQDLDDDGIEEAGEAPALAFQYFTATRYAGSNIGDPDPETITNPLDADATTDPDFDTTLGAVSNPTTLTDVRQVKVTLTVRSSQRDPVTGRFVYRTLRADVKPRNAGLMATVRDSSPPAVPTGLASVDRGDCGRLYVSWNENSEPDLAGYILYYAVTSTGEIFSVTISRGVSHTTSSPYVLANLGDAIQYALTIAAFDYSGNTSAQSAAVIGASGSTDTLPNVADPDTAPASFVASASAGENQVLLSWNAVPEPDVAGYRVWRKTSGFTDAELGLLASTNGTWSGARQVADESMFGDPPAGRVTQTSAGWTLRDDATTEVRGCVEYYYAVAAIKACAGGPHPMTTYAVTKFGRTGPARPTDTTPPAPPTTPPMLQAYPSYLRNYITLTNPSTTDPVNVDFTHTAIAYRTGVSPNYPTFTWNASLQRVETNGTLVECHSSSYGPGTFTGSGQSILHRGTPCDSAYHLNPSVTYYYAAVAVDTCGNMSDPATTNAQVAATQCSDETEGIDTGTPHPAVGNPPQVQNVRGTTKRSLGGVTTSEASLVWDPIDDSFNGIRDLAGYYVFRTEGPTESTPGTGTAPSAPVLTNFDAAKGLQLSPSVQYTGLTEQRVHKAKILAVDCETVTKDDASHSFLTGRYGTSFNTYASKTLIYYPGTLSLDQSVRPRTLGAYHEKLEFQAKNSLHSLATIGSEVVRLRRIAFDWTTPNGGGGGSTERLLKSVTINNGSSTTVLTPVVPVPSGTSLDATGHGFKAGRNTTFTLEFINSSTGTAFKADMRRLRLDAAMTYVPVVRIDNDTAPHEEPTSVADVAMNVGRAAGPQILSVNDSYYIACYYYPSVIYPAPHEPPYGCTDVYPYPSTDAFNHAGDLLAYVQDNSGAGIKRVRVYYAVTAKTVTAAPSLGADFPNTVAPAYLAITFCDDDGATSAPLCGGSGYYEMRRGVPMYPNRRVWFVFVAEDLARNYEAAPDQSLSTTTQTYYYDYQ